MHHESSRAGQVAHETDLQLMQPRLREGLRFVAKAGRRRTAWFRLEDEQLSRFHRVGVAEFEFLSALNGQRTIEECRQACALATNQKRVLSAEQAEALILWAANQSLLQGPFHSTTNQSLASRDTSNRSTLAWLKLPLFNRDMNWQPLVQWASPLFNRGTIAGSIVLWLLALIMVIIDRERFVRDLSTILQPGSWMTLALVWVALKVVHELGHLICCQRSGGRAGEVGIAWMLIAPVAYVDLTDLYRIRSRPARIMTCLAGIYIELIVAAVSILLWWNATNPSVCHLLVTTAVTASVASLLFNLNPLMRLDGYHAVCDWLDRPNLAIDGTKAMQNAAARLFLGRRNAQQPVHIGFAIYGAAVLVYRVLVSMGIITAAYALYGSGVMVVMATIMAIVATPAIVTFYKAIRRECWSRPAAFARMSVVTISIGMLAMGAWQVQRSRQAGWCGIVEYEDDTPIRCVSSGKVIRVLVEPGQHVMAGQPLVELENLAINADRVAAECEFEAGVAKWKRHCEQHLIQEAVSQQQTNAATATRLSHLKKQEQSLLIRAPRNGHVVAMDISNWLGQWFDEGDALLYVVDETKKKVIIAIPQDAMNQNAFTTGEKLQIHIKAGVFTEATVRLVGQQADNLPPHPAMATNVVCMLPVRVSPSDSKAALVMPHFRLEATIADADNLLHPGQAVTMLR